MCAVSAAAQTGSAYSAPAAIASPDASIEEAPLPPSDTEPLPPTSVRPDDGATAESHAVAAPAAATAGRAESPALEIPSAPDSSFSDGGSDASLPPPNPAETPIAVLPPNLRPMVVPAPSTAEIPQSQATGQSSASGAQPDPLNDAQDYTNPEIANYEAAQEGVTDPAQMQSLRAFMAEGSITSPIGLELREATRSLATGQEADGLLVLKVDPGSPAAIAGLHGCHHAINSALTGAAIAATMWFPPAMFVLPILAQSHIGQSYDLIIGVDGNRVTNFLDFEDHMREVRGGELVYFSIVRDGHRRQVTVKIPKDMANLAW
jgi:hypothetical protein